MSEPIFVSLEDATAFNHRLALVAVGTDNALGPLSFASYVLASVIGDHRPREASTEIECASGCGAYPCRTILVTAGNMAFPIDWPIAQTVAAIDRTNMALWLDKGTDSEFSVGGDPREQYTKQSDGHWRYAKIERGRETKSAVIEAKKISAHFLHFVAAEYENYNYPIGWRVEDADWTETAVVARDKSNEWQAELTRPYLVNTAARLSQA